MTRFLKISASVAALSAVLMVGQVRAADPVEEGCGLNGNVGLGYMFDFQTFSDGGESVDNDWNTMFGEGGGVVTCGSWNFQGDMAYYAHETDFDIDGGKDLAAAEGHFGGAMFWREPGMGALGLSASIVNQEIFAKDNDYLRAGAFGEFYVGEQFTLGGSAHFFTGDDFLDNHDGVELAAIAKFYAMPDLSLTLRGDMMWSDIDNEVNYDGVAVTGEVEYLAWDKGLSVFGGARYADRTVSDGGDELSFEDMQVYAGLKFSFGADTASLVERDRTGTYDNTSVMLEKLPDVFSSFIAAIVQ